MLILASASARRLDLLKQIGIVPARVAAPGIDETPRPGELPRALAGRLAAEKARAAAVEAEGAGAVILAADTVVACGRRILPKAGSDDEVRACLALLSGRRHRVYTGVAAMGGGRLLTRVAETRLAFKRLTPEDIDTYIQSGEGRGKAGGYAIQGRAAAFIPWINGSYSNVVGLPLAQTAQLLAQFGLF